MKKKSICNFNLDTSIAEPTNPQTNKPILRFVQKANILFRTSTFAHSCVMTTHGLQPLVVIQQATPLFV